MFGTNITITKAGTYTLSLAEGEENADIYVNSSTRVTEYPYELTVAEGGSVTLNICTADHQVDTVDIVIEEK